MWGVAVVANEPHKLGVGGSSSACHFACEESIPRNQYVRMPERFKGPVCKTGIRRFKSDFSLKDEGFRGIQFRITGSLPY